MIIDDKINDIQISLTDNHVIGRPPMFIGCYGFTSKSWLIPGDHNPLPFSWIWKKHYQEYME